MISKSHIPLTPEQMKLIRLEGIHVLVSILSLIWLLALLAFYGMKDHPFLGAKDLVAYASGILPLLYLIYVVRLTQQIKQDKIKGQVEVLSGIVTDKKVSMSGQGKTLSHTYCLMCDADSVTVTKNLYDSCQLGDAFEIHKLPLSGQVIDYIKR